MVVASLDDDTSASVSNLKVESVTQIVAGGLCCAKAQLYGTLDSETPLNSTLDDTERQIWRATIGANGGFRGAVIKFDITANQSCTLRLRTAVNAGTSTPGAWSAPVAWPWQEAAGGVLKIHSRGWWPYSSIFLPAGTLDIQPSAAPGPTLWLTAYPNHTGPEMHSSGFAHQSGDTWGTSAGNKGCWGATLNCDFTLENNHASQIWGANVSVHCRNTGSPYFGAMRVVLPTAYPKRGLEQIGGSGNPHEALLTKNISNATTPIYVQPQDSEAMRVSIVNGGGATLPVNTKVVGMIAYEEVEDPPE